MELFDYEVELQSQIVSWKCDRHAECVMEFVSEPRHIKLGMNGLLWYIKANPGPADPDFNRFTFEIMDVRQSETPLSLSEATMPVLPAKFNPLLLELQTFMKSVSRAEEALDKWYGFSCLFRRGEEDRRWSIIADAEITAAACKTAREAVHVAANAAAGFLTEINPPLFFRGNTTPRRSKRSGWGIQDWTVADELWAASVSGKSVDVTRRLEFLSNAVERGDVLHWCSVRVFDATHPCFELEVRLEDFLEDDDVVLWIGVASHVAVPVRVSLTDNVEVVCGQEGVETRGSLGLAYLLPDFVRDHITPTIKDALPGPTDNNVVEGLLRHVVRYLAFLRKVCVVCGSDRRREVPPTDTCSNMCKARKEAYEATAGLANAKISEEATVGRREEYVRRLYPNTEVGRMELQSVLKITVVKDEESKKIYEKEVKMGAKAMAPGCSLDQILDYGEAIRRMATMDSRNVANMLGIQMTELWSADD